MEDEPSAAELPRSTVDPELPRTTDDTGKVTTLCEPEDVSPADVNPQCGDGDAPAAAVRFSIGDDEDHSDDESRDDELNPPAAHEEPTDALADVLAEPDAFAELDARGEGVADIASAAGAASPDASGEPAEAPATADRLAQLLASDSDEDEAAASGPPQPAGASATDAPSEHDEAVATVVAATVLAEIIAEAADAAASTEADDAVPAEAAAPEPELARALEPAPELEPTPEPTTESEPEREPESEPELAAEAQGGSNGMAELSAEAEGGGVDGTAEDEASASDTGRGSGGSWRNVLMPLEARRSFTAGLENIASATREVRERAAAMGSRPPRAKPRFGGGAKDRRDDADTPSPTEDTDAPTLDGGSGIDGDGFVSGIDSSADVGSAPSPPPPSTTAPAALGAQLSQLGQRMQAAGASMVQGVQLTKERYESAQDSRIATSQSGKATVSTAAGEASEGSGSDLSAAAKPSTESADSADNDDSELLAALLAEGAGLRARVTPGRSVGGRHVFTVKLRLDDGRRWRVTHQFDTFRALKIAIDARDAACGVGAIAALGAALGPSPVKAPFPAAPAPLATGANTLLRRASQSTIAAVAGAVERERAVVAGTAGGERADRGSGEGAAGEESLAEELERRAADEFASRAAQLDTWLAEVLVLARWRCLPPRAVNRLVELLQLEHEYDDDDADEGSPVARAGSERGKRDECDEPARSVSPSSSEELEDDAVSAPLAPGRSQTDPLAKGAPTANAPANGASANGASANGVSANGASANGASANGASANGASTNGASANGASATGTTDGPATDAANAPAADAPAPTASAAATRGATPPPPQGSQATPLSPEQHLARITFEAGPLGLLLKEARPRARPSRPPPRAVSLTCISFSRSRSLHSASWWSLCALGAPQL